MIFDDLMERILENAFNLKKIIIIIIKLVLPVSRNHIFRNLRFQSRHIDQLYYKFVM